MKKKVFEIELSDDAEIDLDNSFEFYKQDNPNVANTFFKEVDLSFKKIKENPESFPIIGLSIRKYVLKKFPFIVYYKIDKYTIQIIAIFHTSRNPEIWRRRN